MKFQFKLFFKSVSIVIIGCILFFRTSEVSAQSNPFRHYNSDDGLSSNTVYDIEQDDRGFLWFATSAGVCRFDGNSFVRFALEDGLSDNEVLKIKKDSKGRLWLLGFNASVTVIDGDSIFSGLTHPLLQKLSANFFYNSMYEGPDGSIFLSNRRTMHARIRFPETIDSLDPASEYIFFSTKGPVDRMAELELFSAATGDTLRLKKNSKSIFSWCVYRDSLLFLNTEFGVLQIDKALHVNKLVIPAEYLKNNFEMYCDEQQGLWFTAYNNGVSFFPKTGDQYTFYKTFFRTENVTSVFRDSEQNVWFSTHGNGVFMMPANFASVISYTTDDGLSESEAYSILVDSLNRIWMGHKNALVEVIDRETIHKFRLHEDMNSMARVLKLIEHPSDGIMAGTDAGLFLLKVNNTGLDYSRRYLYSVRNQKSPPVKITTIKDLEMAGDSILYIVSIEGIHKFNFGESDTVIFQEMLPVRRYYSVCPDTGLSFWYSDSEGLNRFEHGGSISLRSYHPLLSKRIVDLVKIDGQLIASVEGYGLAIVHSGGTVKQITTREGLLSNHCGRIFKSDHTAYVCTNKGINILDFSGDSVVVIGKITTADGLLSNQVNDVYVRDNMLYAASQRGVSMLDMEKISKRPARQPKIYLMSVTWKGDDVLNIQNPKLSFGSGSLRFHFISPLLSFPEGVAYQYRLNDQDWIDIPSNTFEFNSLQPGPYTFIVRARHLDSGWSEPVSYSFIVPQPFYSAWWFYLALLIGILAVAAIAYSGYVLRLKREQRLKMEYGQQIKQLQDQSVHAAMNPQFIVDSLSAIQQQINLGKTSDAGSNLSRFARLLRLNMQTSREDFVPLSEELERVRLYLEMEKMRLGEKLMYQVEVDQSVFPDEVLIPTMIIQPFIENSVIHGIHPADHAGKVRVVVSADRNQLVIAIDDNGVGVSPGSTDVKKQNGSTLSGIPLIRQRLELLRNKTGKEMSLTIRNKDGKPESGTLVTILLPLLNDV